MLTLVLSIVYSLLRLTDWIHSTHNLCTKKSNLIQVLWRWKVIYGLAPVPFWLRDTRGFRQNELNNNIILLNLNEGITQSSKNEETKVFWSCTSSSFRMLGELLKNGFIAAIPIFKATLHVSCLVLFLMGCGFWQNTKGRRRNCGESLMGCVNVIKCYWGNAKEGFGFGIWKANSFQKMLKSSPRSRTLVCIVFILF